MNTPLSKHNTVPIQIEGDSMWPTLKCGQKLSVEFVSHDLKDEDIGSIYLFKNQNHWVCHRYLGKRNEFFIFKGDYSTVADFLDTPRLLGKVIGVYKNAGIKKMNQKNIFLNWAVYLQKKSLSKKANIKKLYRYLSLCMFFLILCCAKKITHPKS